MRLDDPNTPDRLDHALDALAMGARPDAEPWLTGTDNRLRALDGAFALPADVRDQIWEGFMGSSTTASTLPATENLASLPSPNGTAPARRLRGWLPDGRGERRHSWVSGVSTAALLLLVLVVGYGAFRLAGPDRPGGGGAGIPAGVFASPTDVATPAPTMSPGQGIAREPIELSVMVNAEGVLAGDQEALEDARVALQDVLADLPAGCRVGVTFTSGYAEDIGDGNQLADAINRLLRDEFPDLFDTSAFDSVAFISPPTGQVDLHLYVFFDCQESANSELQLTPTIVAFVPTDQTSPDHTVNLRTEPTTESRIVSLLPASTPLHFLGQIERDSAGVVWLKVVTEQGETGWLPANYAVKIGTPTPTD